MTTTGTDPRAPLIQGDSTDLSDEQAEICQKILEGRLLAAIYEHEWVIAPNGQPAIDVVWLLRLLNDPKAAR